MTRDEVIQQVVDITGRYDKMAYCTGIIDSICVSVAAMLDNPLDLVEESITVDNNSLIHNIQLQPNFLKVAYLRPAPYLKLLAPIEPSKAIVGDRELVNVYYRSGNILIIRLGTYYRTDTLLFGWYSKPAALTGGNSTNWVITDYPDLIINLLAARVYAITGDSEAANAMRAEANLRLQELRDALTTGGVARQVGMPSVQ